MLRIVVICLVAALVWAGWWGVSAWQMQRATDAFIEDRRTAGWDAGYSDMTLRGFPNRLDRRFDELILGNPRDEWRIEMSRLGVYQLTYKPGHQILAIDGPVEMTRGGATWTIDSDGLRASVVHDGGLLNRADAEADVVNVTSQDGALALANPKTSVRQLGDRKYQIATTSDQFRMGDSARVGTRLAVNLEVTLDESLHLDHSAAALRPTDIEILLARYDLDGLQVEATGHLRVDQVGRPQGRVNLRAVNWRDLLRAAIDAGQVQRELGLTLEAGLSLLAGLQGNPQTLDIPLDLEGDNIRLGPVSIGATPRLWRN